MKKTILNNKKKKYYEKYEKFNTIKKNNLEIKKLIAMLIQKNLEQNINEYK